MVRIHGLPLHGRERDGERGKREEEIVDSVGRRGAAEAFACEEEAHTARQERRAYV